MAKYANVREALEDMKAVVEERELENYVKGVLGGK